MTEIYAAQMEENMATFLDWPSWCFCSKNKLRQGSPVIGLEKLTYAVKNFYSKFNVLFIFRKKVSLSDGISKSIIPIQGELTFSQEELQLYYISVKTD